MSDGPLLVLDRVRVGGSWGGRPFDGAGALALHRADAQLVVGDARIAIQWRQLSDATLERGTLHLHRPSERLSITGDAVSTAWAQVIAHACPMPEFARGLRALGHARGGAAEAQGRFFGPLLAARRRAADPEAVERRVTQFDPGALTSRMRDELAALAAAKYADHPPHRRALEAHFEEAAEPCLAALERLQEAGSAVHAAPDGMRFVEWRRWTLALRRVFLEADRTWEQVTRLLEGR